MKRKIFDLLLKLITFIFLLEPVWMLLPFAGFMYGSVTKIETISDNPTTAWLNYFILPTQTLLPIAILLISIGLIIFILGAFQIYRAKLLKIGLVKTYIYKKFRNPQYTGLLLFSVGFLMIWGRFITYILLACMFFAYYLLAKKEQDICHKTFGEEYEEYMKTTYFFIQGERLFAPLGRLGSKIIPNKLVLIVTSFILLQVLVIGSGFGILKLRESAVNNIPTVTSSVILTDGKELTFSIVKDSKHFDSQSEKAFLGINQIAQSPKVQESLAKLQFKDYNTLFAFPISRTIRPKKDYYTKGQYDFYIVALKAPVSSDKDKFMKDWKNWDIKGAFIIEKIDPSKPELYETSGTINMIEKESSETHEHYQQRISSVIKAYLYSFKEQTVGVYKIFER